jgi:hypothetical protein
MLAYSKGSVVPFKTVHYNGYVEASMHGYNNCTVGPLKTVHYNG